MKKKLIFFVLIILIFKSSYIIGNSFCGGYFGLNFNFGILTLSSDSCANKNTFTKNGDLVLYLKRNNRQVFSNTVGGGITLGYNYTNNCWLIGPEFNGFFYGNPNNLEHVRNFLGVDCTDSNKISNKFIGIYKIKNNIRLDGILKFGILFSDCSLIYLLAGASGINLQKNNSFVCNDNPLDNACYMRNKWRAGGVFGIGTRTILNGCLDAVIEFRYSLYQKWLYTFKKFPTYKHVSLNRPQAYIGLVGLNWDF